MNILLQGTYDRLPEWVAVICTVLVGIKISGRSGTIFALIVVAAAFLAAVPLLVILMVSAGAIDMLDLRWAGGWADRWALIFDFLIMCILIFVPQLLRPRLPWGGKYSRIVPPPGASAQVSPTMSGQDRMEDDTVNVQAILPSWLALAAALVTFALVSSLHFLKGGQLASFNLWLVAAGSVGVVTLLIPFYCALARASWRWGFDPKKWREAQFAAWRVIWHHVQPDWLRRLRDPAPGNAERIDAYLVGRDKVAEVSKKWFRVADTYGVEVDPGQDPVVILAVTVVLDTMAHPAR